MQFQVPQNIDLEDKIVGPLTLKQFLYLLVGGMLDYAWFTIFDTSLFILLALPTTLFAIAMAFFRVQDQPFPKFLGSLIIFVIRPKILTWGKTIKPKIIEAPDAKKEKIVHPKMSSESQIEKLAKIIDTQGWGATPEKAKTPFQEKESFVEKVMRVGNQPIGGKSSQPAVASDASVGVRQRSSSDSRQKSEVIRPQMAQPQTKDWQPPKNAQIISEEELEKELGLSGRVKSAEKAKPEVNLGPASENNPEDVLDIPENPTGGKK